MEVVIAEWERICTIDPTLLLPLFSIISDFITLSTTVRFRFSLL